MYIQLRLGSRTGRLPGIQPHLLSSLSRTPFPVVLGGEPILPLRTVPLRVALANCDREAHAFLAIAHSKLSNCVDRVHTTQFTILWCRC